MERNWETEIRLIQNALDRLFEPTHKAALEAAICALEGVPVEGSISAHIDTLGVDLLAPLFADDVAEAIRIGMLVLNQLDGSPIARIRLSDGVVERVKRCISMADVDKPHVDDVAGVTYHVDLGGGYLTVYGPEQNLARKAVRAYATLRGLSDHIKGDGKPTPFDDDFMLVVALRIAAGVLAGGCFKASDGPEYIGILTGALRDGAVTQDSTGEPYLQDDEYEAIRMGVSALQAATPKMA